MVRESLRYPDAYRTDSPSGLAWAGLLGMWMEFARSAVVLPEDADGDRWRASVPHLVNLMANARAIQDVGALGWDEHALAVDRAGYAMRVASQALSGIWSGVPMPAGVLETLSDGRRALDAAAYIADVVVYEGEGAWEVPDNLSDMTKNTQRFESSVDGIGTFVFVASPGTLVQPGCPVMCVRGLDGDAIGDVIPDCIEGCGVRLLGRGPGVQVYRSLLPVRGGDCWVDSVVGLGYGLPAGRPLLIESATSLGAGSDPALWRGQQAAAMDGFTHVVTWDTLFELVDE